MVHAYIAPPEYWRISPGGDTSITSGARSSGELRSLSLTTTALAGVDLLESIFVFSNYLDVRDFIIANPALVGTIFEASGKIEEVFGPGTEIVLETLHDPEECSERELFISILTSLSADDALRKFDQVCDDWWIGASDDVRTRMNLDIEFT